MESHHFEEQLSEGGSSLNVIVEIGTIEVVPHDGQLITVDAETQQMVLTVHRDQNLVTVRAERDDSEDTLWKRANERLKRQGPEANVRVQVPADCVVNAKAVSGKLLIRDLEAPVTARVVTGQAQLENLTGPIYAKTTTGSVKYQGGLGDHEHRFETVTGQLRLIFTQEPDAKLDARTVTGRVHCDFPLKEQVRQARVAGTRLNGVLGSGEGQLLARVVTGVVSLERAWQKNLDELGETKK